jgi:hypothetical protein
LDEILEIYHPTDAPEDADLDTALGYWNFAAGNLAFALERFDATVRRTAGDATMGLDSAGISHQCWAHTLAGQALSQMGRISEALDRLDGVADTARAIGAGENVVWAHGALIDTSRLAGGAQLLGGVDPRRLAAEGVQIAESVGSSYTRVLAELWLAAAFLLEQDWGAAEQHAQAGLARCLETQTAGENVPRFHGVLGEARRGQGDLEGAVVAMEEAARTGDSGGMVFFAAQARSELANLLVETGAPADVIFEVIRRGREQVAQTGGHSVGARLTEAEAGLAGREGDPVRREQGLCEAERAFREMGATGHAERLARRACVPRDGRDRARGAPGAGTGGAGFPRRRVAAPLLLQPHPPQEGGQRVAYGAGSPMIGSSSSCVSRWRGRFHPGDRCTWSWSLIRPSSTASGRGGQPGM